MYKQKVQTVIRSLDHNHKQSSLDNSANSHMFDVPSLHVSDDFSSSLSLPLHPSSVISHSQFPSYFTFHSFISFSLSLIVFFSSPVSLSVASLTSWTDLSVANCVQRQLVTVHNDIIVVKLSLNCAFFPFAFVQ